MNWCVCIALIAGSFLSQDAAITTSMPVFDLVDSIKPGAVTYDDIKHDTDEEVCYFINGSFVMCELCVQLGSSYQSCSHYPVLYKSSYDIIMLIIEVLC